VWWVTPAVPEGASLPAGAVREIVFIIPGTHGNAETWFTQVPGRSTFASELAAAFGSDVTVRRLLWNGDFRQSHRAAAAEQMAREIDLQSEGFDRVHVLGHSHGGNIALMAARRTHRRIDTLVCLGTPHLYFEMSRAPERESVWVPIFVPPSLGERVGRIVNVHSSRDAVTPDVADWFNGVTVSEAADLTREWRRNAQDVALYEDDIMSHMFGSSRVRASELLANQDFARLEDVGVPSLTGTGLDVHSQLHCRRMGRALGLVLSGARARPVVRTVLLTEDTDEGEATEPGALDFDPEDPATGAWIARVHLKLEPAVVDLELDGGGEDLPDPQVRLDDEVLAEGGDTLTLEVETERLVPDGVVVVTVTDGDLIGSDPIGAPWELSVVDGRLEPRHEPSEEQPWTLEWDTWAVW